MVFRADAGGHEKIVSSSSTKIVESAAEEEESFLASLATAIFRSLQIKRSMAFATPAPFARKRNGPVAWLIMSRCGNSFKSTRQGGASKFQFT